MNLKNDFSSEIPVELNYELLRHFYAEVKSGKGQPLTVLHERKLKQFLRNHDIPLLVLLSRTCCDTFQLRTLTNFANRRTAALSIL